METLVMFVAVLLFVWLSLPIIALVRTRKIRKLELRLAGVEAADVAYRLDGLPLGLKKLLPAACPSDYQVLRDLQLFFQ